MSATNSSPQLTCPNSTARGAELISRVRRATSAAGSAVPGDVALSWLTAAAPSLLGFGHRVTSVPWLLGTRPHLQEVGTVAVNGADGDLTGLLRLHCPAAGYPSQADVAVLQLAAEQIADQAALSRLRREAWTEQDRAAHLERALIANRSISTAVGIVMATYHLSSEQAFDAVERASQHRNVTLAAIADEVLSTDLLNDPAVSVGGTPLAHILRGYAFRTGKDIDSAANLVSLDVTAADRLSDSKEGGSTDGNAS